MTASISGTNGVTFPDTSVQPIAAGSYTMGFKNRIINGAMVIDQRNGGNEVNPAAQAVYYLDRWQVLSTAASKFKIGQNAGAVTPPAGYSNYLGCTSLSAYTVGASETFAVRQQIEGLNVADLAWGTASAATVTLSFWVRSSLTGTFGGVLENSGGSRGYPFTYTINSASTWEQKTVTIPGDTTGTWLTTNGVGIIVVLSIGAGATVSGTAGAWASANYSSATGAVSVVGTNGATWYVTGVQLEKGSTATSFDVRPYGTELQLCQRYYEPTDTTARDPYGSGYFATSTSVTSFWRWSVEKRAIPALTASSTAAGVVTVNYGSASAQNSAASSITFSLISSKSSRVDFTVASAVTAGTSALVSSRGDNGYYLSADAEL